MRKRDEMEVLFEAIVTGDGSRAIMVQEARGQQDLINSEALPIEGYDRTTAEAMGIKFGEQIDDLFIEATLPPDWKKVATSHSMHSTLMDDKGRERASIFYKAAFYDRSARMGLTRRFLVTTEPICGYGDNYDRDETRNWGVIKDCGVIFWRTEPYQNSTLDKDFKAADIRRIVAQAEAELQLIALGFPDWQNPLAYWD